jgi:hypothetical protein
MSGEPVVIQLNWEDPVTGESQSASRQLPIAIGRDASKMPTHLDQQSVSQLELVHQQVSRCHAVISMVNRQLYISDKSANGTFLNGRLIQKSGQVLTSKDTVRVGPFKLTAVIVNNTDANSTELNRDYSHIAKSEMATTEPNAILGWLIGGGVLLLLGVGLWFAAQTLLKRAQPSIEPAESSLNISDTEIGAIEIPTKMPTTI